MGLVGLVSDSTAGLPATIVERHGIRVVPLYVSIGEHVFREGVDLSYQEFYERLPTADPLPTTSQPSPGDFAKAYESLVRDGATSIISIHLSSGISGTIGSAKLAARNLGIPVTVVDTRCAVGVHRLAVEAAAVTLARGGSHDEAVEVAEAVVAAHRTAFVVDTLEYLHKGGRIGGASALLGSMLQLKPLLHFVDGEITSLEKVRSSGRALERLVEIMAEWVVNEEPMRAVIMHAACPDRADRAIALLQERLQIATIDTVLLTPVIGAHVGNGTLGICCCPSRLAPRA
ncbi:MAG: DegV family protein [Anaerolineae bacterium]